jgi:hypothetical protein
MNTPVQQMTEIEKESNRVEVLKIIGAADDPEKALRLYAQLEADRLERQANVLWTELRHVEQEAEPYVRRVKAATKAWHDIQRQVDQLRLLFPAEKPPERPPTSAQ